MSVEFAVSIDWHIWLFVFLWMHKCISMHMIFVLKMRFQHKWWPVKLTVPLTLIALWHHPLSPSLSVLLHFTAKWNIYSFKMVKTKPSQVVNNSKAMKTHCNYEYINNHNNIYQRKKGEVIMAIRLYVRMVASFSFSPYHHTTKRWHRRVVGASVAYFASKCMNAHKNCRTEQVQFLP